MSQVVMSLRPLLYGVACARAVDSPNGRKSRQLLKGSSSEETRLPGKKYFHLQASCGCFYHDIYARELLT